MVCWKWFSCQWNKWEFPEIGVSSNHPFLDGIVPSKASMLGYPPFLETPKYQLGEVAAMETNPRSRCRFSQLSLGWPRKNVRRCIANVPRRNLNTWWNLEEIFLFVPEIENETNTMSSATGKHLSLSWSFVLHPLLTRKQINKMKSKQK